VYRLPFILGPFSWPQTNISSGSKKRGHVTDDCEGTLKWLKTVIEGWGYDVVTLQNKVDALKRFGEIKPDLVTTDLTSPQMSGLDFIRVVKELDPSMPVIIMSGSITMEKAREAVRLGVVECFDKPFDVAHLGRRLSRH
jgi:DNA-binding NtrC family response regulator